MSPVLGLVVAGTKTLVGRVEITSVFPVVLPDISVEVGVET